RPCAGRAPQTVGLPSPATSLRHHQLGVHATEVMAGHVAEQLVAARSQSEPELAEAARRARLEPPDLRRFERVLIDRDTVDPERQRRAPCPHHDELVLL